MSVPVNVLTGFLGVGKTTAILHLLQDRSERWAVLVNEYGDVSIDGAILQADGVSVREVGGGCICCTTAPYLQVALHLLLTESKPTRLLIETTGLGHPANLLETLRRNYADRLEVRAIVGLVAAVDALDPAMAANAIFQEQVEIADVLVMNRMDETSPDQLQAFQEWAEGLFPPKLLIAATEQGRLAKSWLDLTPGKRLTILESASPTESTIRTYESPQQGKPIRRVTKGETPACGWIFTAEEVFDEAKLLALFTETKSARMKGVFHIPEEWIVIQKARGTVTVTPTSYRHDSRVEVIGDVDWDQFEMRIMSCRSRS